MKELINKILFGIKKTSVNQFPYDIEIIAENLEIPWALDISDSGTIYVTERTGSIRIIENGRLLLQPLIRLRSPFVSTGEGGLMGLVLDLNFSENHYMYVMHTYEENDQLFNRVIRLIVNNLSARIDTTLIDRIPGGRIHNGGRIKIGPDNKLYITTGDVGNSLLSQDVNSLAGKILRIELDGSIPEDNPYSNSPVYCIGLRNPQGLAWNSNNNLYATDHGSSAHDEINLILPGANYGWPLVQGNESSNEINVQIPIIQSGEETWAPSGLAFANEGPWQGSLIAACLRGEQLLVAELNGNGRRILNTIEQLKNQYGRLRDIIQAKEGTIYISTSNMDGRGSMLNGGDKIIKLIPKMQ
jgi:glucose/arabinose dehydrogenase